MKNVRFFIAKIDTTSKLTREDVARLIASMSGEIVRPTL